MARCRTDCEQPWCGIYTDLTARRDGTGVDLTGVRHLPENAGVAFMGDTKGGPFDVAGDQAHEWLRLPTNPNGRTNADVLKPWINGNGPDPATGGEVDRRLWVDDGPPATRRCTKSRAKEFRGAAGGEVEAVVAGAPSWQSRQPALRGRTLDVTRDTRSRCMAGRRTPVPRIQSEPRAAPRRGASCYHSILGATTWQTTI